MKIDMGAPVGELSAQLTEGFAKKFAEIYLERRLFLWGAEGDKENRRLRADFYIGIVP